MELKPGYQSTEFYVTLISQAIGILALTGVVIPDQIGELSKAIITIIGALISIVPAVVYIFNRTWLKSKVSGTN
ncbi:MAG: hypothetical protein M1484_04500 [Patescibacteria group bacterium]|nr:hypothetical protein [Patescibacteria group bacterium]MCL5432319.1 hypothetical protein [Patescibacteria group bacterium]